MSSIVTFYSFKGGVGRSMALANIAALLVQKGLRVLAVDWDLEAPGLDRYFLDYEIKSNNEWAGLLDLLIDASASTERPDWKNYVCTVDLKGTHQLTLMTSGRQDEHYAGKVLNFNWNTFFAHADGGNFIEFLRDEWRNEFDVTLIDSRTGITDSGGICTIQLPDVLVLVFTSNEQSLTGVKEVALRAQKGRQLLAFDRMPLLVLPLPSRFEGRAQFVEAKEWLTRFSKDLAPFYKDWIPKTIKPHQILERTKLPYVAYFSFGEKLPAITEGTSDPESLGYAYQAAATLIGDEFKNAERLINNSMGQEFLTDERQTNESSIINTREVITGNDYQYDIFVSYQRSRITEDWIKHVVGILSYWLTAQLGNEARIFMDDNMAPGQSFPLVLTEALKKSKCLLTFLTAGYFRSEWCMEELETFFLREKVTGFSTAENPPSLIIPIALHGISHFPDEIINRQILDWQDKFSTSTKFWDTVKAVEVEDDIRNLSIIIAKTIKDAPAFRTDWPIPSKTKSDFNRLDLPKF